MLLLFSCLLNEVALFVISYGQMTQEAQGSKERNEEICKYIEASSILQAKDLVKSIGMFTNAASSFPPSILRVNYVLTLPFIVLPNRL